MKGLSFKFFKKIFNYFRYSVYLPDGNFGFVQEPVSGWVHAVLNFIGPNEGQGIRIYNDGRLIGTDTTKFNASFTQSDGRIQIGRADLNVAGTANTMQFYASVDVDDLLIYNRSLTEPEIILLKQIIFLNMLLFNRSKVIMFLELLG